MFDITIAFDYGIVKQLNIPVCKNRSGVIIKAFIKNTFSLR